MKRAGVLGWPISHSLSPALHGHWLERLEIDGRYDAVPVAPGDFAAAADRLLKQEGWRGFNVTIPHKESAFAYCAVHDEAAQILGAVNTVILRDDGKIEGRNTDLFGFVANLESDPRWQSIGRKQAVLIGAGGAARAVLKAMLDWGFEDIIVANRTLTRADSLIGVFSASAGSKSVQSCTMESVRDALDGADLVVNSTSLGMKGQPELHLPLDALPVTAMVTDIVYTPLETELLAAARARGNPTVDGLGMLLHQAAAGFQAWFGTQELPPVDETLRHHVLAVREAMAT